MDMAVGIIIGAACGTIIQSLIKDVLMPPRGDGGSGASIPPELFLVMQERATAVPYVTLAATSEA